MPGLWDAFKSKVAERANWDTFKREIGQGFEMLPPAMHIPVAASKIPSYVKAIKTAGNEVSELYPSTDYYQTIKAMLDADTGTAYKSLENSPWHEKILEALGFPADKMGDYIAPYREAYRNNLARYYATPSEVGLEAVANEKMLKYLKDFYETKAPIAPRYYLDLFSPGRINPLERGTKASGVFKSPEEVVRFLKQVMEHTK